MKETDTKLSVCLSLITCGVSKWKKHVLIFEPKILNSISLQRFIHILVLYFLNINKYLIQNDMRYTVKKTVNFKRSN